MRFRKRAITFLLCAFGLLAASPAMAVVNASGDGAEVADSVVMVLTRGPEGSGLCTAVVLGPKTLLTAAHCLRAPAEMRVYYRDASGQPVITEVMAALAHPDYHADAAVTRRRSRDIGLIGLKSALPASFRPAALAVEDPPAAGSPITVAGFGVTREGDWKSSGRLASADMRVREPRSTVLLWTAPVADASGACSGDSGGPIFEPNHHTVIAIIAWTEGRARAKCGSLTQGVLVAPLAQWLTAAMRQLGDSIGMKDGE